MHRLKQAYRALEDFWLCGVDPRIYAMVRICFAVVAICNLADLWPHRYEFFSQEGLIDLPTLRENIGSDPYYSVFLWSSDERAVTAVFAISVLSLCCLGLGVWQRPAAIAAFIWHLSYSYRAFPIIHGWDELLRMIAFVVMISPTSDVWSIRHILSRPRSRPPSRTPRHVPRHGLVLLQVQLFVVYWQTLWLKLADQYWRNGEFVSYFQLSMYSRVPSEFWAHAEIASNLLTFGTLFLELTLPLLLVFKRSRWLGIALGFCLHAGILVLSTVWLFSLTIWILYFAFLDEDDLAQVGRIANRLRNRS